MASTFELSPEMWKDTVPHLDALIAGLTACGFDESAYFERYPKVRGGWRDRARVHYLRHGVAGDRQPICGPLPDGLGQLASIHGLDPAYHRLLFRGVFLGQVRHSQSAARLSGGIGGDVIELIRTMGGLPYYIVGDSHTRLYARRKIFGDHWLAPLPMLYPAAAAIYLNKKEIGPSILRWAENAAARKGVELPVFLKLGGMDAESIWIWERIRRKIKALTADGFSAFVQESLAEYAVFLERLTRLIERRQLRVCTVFPSVVADAEWVEAIIGALGGPKAERQRQVRTSLAGMELPDLRQRTQMRAEYNAGLRNLCQRLDLRFIDDFTPALGEDGILDPTYRNPQKKLDHHIDFAASEALLVPIIRDALLDAP